MDRHLVVGPRYLRLVKLPGLISKGGNLTEWSRILESYLRSITPKGSGSVRVSCGSGGATFAIDPPDPNPASTPVPLHPFQILAAGQNLGIFPESSIFKSLNGETVPITGLLSDETDMSDPGWFACPAIGHKIWLQIGTANPNDSNHTLCIWPGTTKIQSGEAGGTLWEEYPDPISITGSGAGAHQEFYNLLLAEVTDPETDTRPAILTVTIGEGASSEKRQITQCWSRNVMPVTWEVNGLVGMVPIDPTLDYPPTPL